MSRPPGTADARGARVTRPRQKMNPDRTNPPGELSIRVYYEDTDTGGVVYYANYFVWFEVARADLLRSLGWTYREMELAGVALPVITAECQYHRGARYDDELDVRAEGRLLSPAPSTWARPSRPS